MTPRGTLAPQQPAEVVPGARRSMWLGSVTVLRTAGKLMGRVLARRMCTLVVRQMAVQVQVSQGTLAGAHACNTNPCDKWGGRP